MRITVVLLSVLALVMSSCGGSKELKDDDAFSPERNLAKAEKLVEDKEFEEARRTLTEVKNRDTTKKYAPLAQLRIADSFIKEKEPDLGIEEYKKFLEFYPDNQYAPYAQYQIGMAYFSQIESPDRGSGVARKALEEFLRLRELYPRNPYREVLPLRIEKCRTVIADGALLIGEFYYKKGSYKAAVDRLEGLLKQFPEYKRGDETMALLARSYKALKMDYQAKAVFQKLLEKYPSSKFAREAKKGSL